MNSVKEDLIWYNKLKVYAEVCDSQVSGDAGDIPQPGYHLFDLNIWIPKKEFEEMYSLKYGNVYERKK